MNRRGFIQLSSCLSGGWVLSQLAPLSALANDGPDCFQPSPLIKLCSDGKIIVYVYKQEMGQGVQTSLPIIVAEELEADLNNVVAEALPYAAGNKFNYSTGGSTSVLYEYTPLRKAGAAAREMLIAAAAQVWGISPDNCRAQKSRVINTITNQSIPYKDLITKAAALPVPKEPALKNYKDFSLIGKSGIKKNNLKDIVTGRMKYGLDLKLPGMLYAVIVRCPVMGGKITSWDESSVKNIDGLVKLFEMKEMGAQLETRSGVAIVAKNRWAALQAQRSLKVEWAYPDGALTRSSAGYFSEQSAKLKQKPDVVYDVKGNVIPELSPITKDWVSAGYQIPFVAHAAMEPLNCTAQFKDGKFELWGGFQNPGKTATVAAKFFGLGSKDVFINLMPLGGGFGRRLGADYSAEAMQVAQQIPGAPVQLMFTREDDMKFDFYRPASTHQLSAMLGADKRPSGWQHKIAIAPVADFMLGMKGSKNWLSMEAEGGAYGDMYYNIPALQSAVTRTESPLVEGWWRAVNFTYNNVVIECFVDELAKKAGLDPVAYRLLLLKDMPAGKIKGGALYEPERLAAVVSLAAEKMDWNKKRPAGRGLGIACCFYNHAKAYTAHAFEVSVSKTKKITIHRAIVATDVGTVIDVDGFRNQVEGGFVWGLSAVLKSEITVSKGAVQESSFFDFQVCRLPDVPPLEIHVVESSREPGGAGETSVPSVMPALMNAIAAATGERIRTTPIKNKGYTI